MSCAAIGIVGPIIDERFMYVSPVLHESAASIRKRLVACAVALTGAQVRPDSREPAPDHVESGCAGR